MIPQNSKVFIACPAYGSAIMSETTASLFNLGTSLQRAGVPPALGFLDYPDVADARNVFLTIFYDSLKDATHILFVDHDMRFDPDLVFSMLDFNEPVVGCVYRKKQMQLEFVGNDFGGGNFVRGGFKRMDDIGFGVTLIQRSAVEGLLGIDGLADANIDRLSCRHLIRNYGATRLIRAFDKMGQKSEDISFCHRWTGIGGEIWANISHEVGHIGRHEFVGRYQDVMQAQPAPPKFG